MAIVASDTQAEFDTQVSRSLRRKSEALDRAYDEYCDLIDAGNRVDPAEFCARFPSVRASLRRLLQVHSYLHSAAHDAAAEIWHGAAPGQEFHGFELLEELGRGRFGRVFLARENRLGDRQVVVKLTTGAEQEAKILGTLAHPNIVPVHAVYADVEHGLSLICMPFLGRLTLCDVIDAVADHALGAPAEDSASIQRLLGLRSIGCSQEYHERIAILGAAMAEGLGHAHAQGVLHLDLKPSNMLLTSDGEPMLLDFNLAHQTDHVGLPIGGTLPYMSPEQLQAFAERGSRGAASIGPSCDIFSLGVVLYELLTGDLPFPCEAATVDADAVAAQLSRQIQGRTSALERLRHATDRGLMEIVAKCLELDPAARFASAAEVAAALRRYWAPPQRFRRRVIAHKWRYGGFAAMAVCAVTLVALWLALRPSFVERQFVRGAAAYRAGEFREAIRCFSRVLDEEPRSADTLLARGHAFQGLGDFSLAALDFYSARQLMTGGFPHACEAYCKGKLAQHEAAVGIYQKAIASGYDTAVVYNNLGYEQIAVNQYDEAEQTLERAIQLDPQLAAAYVNRVRLAIRRYVRDADPVSQTEIDDLDRAIALCPDSAEVNWHGATLLIYAGWAEDHLDRSARLLARAIELGMPAPPLESNAHLAPILTHAAVLKASATAKPKPQGWRMATLIDPFAAHHLASH
jgi:serine/threonine protein kinase/Tfp pilus assembly protein PilF